MKNIDGTPKTAERSIRHSVMYELWCRFYPLAMTDFAMTLGDMMRPIALARLPNTELTLAAVGVIKSIAVLLESPIIMILHASTALSNNKNSHQALFRFTVVISGILTSIFLALGFQPLYHWLFVNIFGVSQTVAMIARLSFILMIPWPALIAIRRFYQGLLVRDRMEKSMALAGLMRLLFTMAVLWIGTHYQFEGTLVAALSLVGAVAIEAGAVIYFTRRSKNHYPHEYEIATLPKNTLEIAHYYAPLGVTSLVVWAARALLIVVIARSQEGIFGIAVWTAASGFILPVANATRMVQQIVISSSNISYQILLRFALLIGGSCCLILFALSSTDLGMALINFLLGDNIKIATSLSVAIQICFLVPLLTVLQNAYQGFLILNNSHWWINMATIVNAMILLIVATIMVSLNVSGPIAAAVATFSGLAVEVILLMMKNRANLRRHSS